MLSKEDNELITRTGPGTPMGNAMRRYWVPRLPVERDRRTGQCAGARQADWVRNSSPSATPRGASGWSKFCPHRRVSLYCGRNEECGLRCVYHGWKFDVTRRLRRSAERAGGHSEFKYQVKLVAYPTCELGADRLGLPRAGREDAALAEIRLDPGAEARRHVTKVVSRNATTCRRSKAASTPRTRRSCAVADRQVDARRPAGTSGRSCRG